MREQQRQETRPRKKKEGLWKFHPGKLNQSSKNDIYGTKNKRRGHIHIFGTTKLSPYLDFEVTFLPLLDPGFLFLQRQSTGKLSNGSNREKKQRKSGSV